jgi:Flp pilus assembly protein TadG
MVSRRHRTEIRARPADRGQAMMEFTVVATLFTLLVAGVLEFGRVWSAANVLNAAAHDGARLAAVTDTNNQRQQKVQARVAQSAATYFASSNVTAQVTTATGSSGEPVVTVAATGKMNLLFGAALIGKSLTMTRTVTMRDETLAN